MPPAAPTSASDLLLKVTPPRVPRHLIARPALAARHPSFQDRPVVLVQAPAGFGKTSLLAQWRLEHIAQGSAVAWLQAQPQDDAVRFVRGLALAVRSGAGRPNFGHVLLDATPSNALEGATGWLAEVAQSALQLVLVVDEADNLPAPARDALAYVLHNAPPNLRCIVGARPGCELEIDDLVAYGQAVVVDAAQLRFSLADTIELLRQRFGETPDADAAARLHEITEGWPLGLQLALSVAGPAGHAGMPPLDPHGGALRAQFVGHLLANLDPGDVRFLALASAVDPLHPDLCAALADDPQAPQRLARLLRDTPIFTASQEGEWVRMHALACEAMRQRFDALPADERSGVRRRAAAWFAQHDMLQEAAAQLLHAGDAQQAYDLAERSLYNSLMTRGRQAAVLEWLARLPSQELDHRPALLLAAAWSLAVSERHEEAQRLVERLLSRPGVDDGLRCECALILGGAALFADLPDHFAELHRPWAEHPPLTDPQLLQVHANRRAFLALLEGEPALARLYQQMGPAAGAGGSHLLRWGSFILALSYYWEGQVVLADQLLRPVIAAAEADLGRRSPVACVLAALHAASLWERDQPQDAVAVLANRLDVVERSGPPEAVLLGYRTLARVAAASGAEHRALELLGGLDAVGIARKLPRLRVVSLAEQVRLHARSWRGDTCRALSKQLDDFLETPGLPQGPLWQRGVRMLQAATRGYAAVAAQDWRGALQPLARADEAAVALKQGRVHIELLGLRAFAMERCGERAAQPLLREALELARSYGLQRVFRDTHPELGAWVKQAVGDAVTPLPMEPAVKPAAEPVRPRAAPSMALTPKEREVLALLARGLSNKEIGRALQVGEETVKWHLKNLFAKLDAGTRKQVVSRARIFGLLSDAA